MENLVSLSLNRKDGHGGRAEEHRAEMEEIARKVFEIERAKLMDEMSERMRAAQYEAYNQALQDVMRVLEYDIHSVTKIGIDGCREIFEGEKAQRFISDQIMKRITKELNSQTFRP